MEGDGATPDLPAAGLVPAGPSAASCSLIAVLGVGRGL